MPVGTRKGSEMVVAGVDVGARNVKVVVLRDGLVVARASVASSFDQESSASRCLASAAAGADVDVGDFTMVAATGVGRRQIAIAEHHLTEVSAMARGAFALDPSARTVIDIGAEEARAARLDETGRVLDFAVNEKCAAGTGAFVEAMARALEVGLEEFGELSLSSTQTIPMNAQCTVFAESEVVSLIHANTSPADIAGAVHGSMASRVSAIVRRAGIAETVVIGGGVAHNAGFVASLAETLGLASLRVLPHPDYLGAHGAALAALEKAEGAEPVPDADPA